MTPDRLREILSRFSTHRVLVIGDLMLDHYLWGITQRISPEAPVPVVNIESETYRPGGAANVAYNLRALGATVAAAGIIGRDDNGEHLKTALRHENIDLSGIVETPHRPTTSKTRIMGHTQYRQQQQMMRIDREVTHPLEGQLLGQLRRAIARARAPAAIFVSDYAKGVVTTQLMDAVRHVFLTQVPIIVDPKGRNFDKYQGVTAISPNQSEALGVFNLDDANEKTIIDIGHRLVKQCEIAQVYMTRSEKGVALFEAEGRVTHIPATARDVFDVSGAGDTTAAVYTLALLSGASPAEAAYIGNLAGGVVVGKVGVDAVSVDELINAGHMATQSLS